MKIEIDNPMSVEAKNGIDGYQPIFRGQPLEVEASLPEVSLRNLRVLLHAGLEVATMLVVENGNILIVFTGGETYLATGFAVGQVSDLSKFFAQFASEAMPAYDMAQWENHLAYHHDESFRGVIEPSQNHQSDTDGPRVFNG